MAESRMHTPNGINLADVIKANPELLEYSLNDISLLLRTSERLITSRPFIPSSARPSKKGRPFSTCPSAFLWRVTGMKQEVSETLWSFLVNSFQGRAYLSDATLEDMFTIQGLNEDIVDSELVAYHHFAPTQVTCERFCGSTLRHGTTIGAWYYNLGRGVVPALQTSKRCVRKDCGATYHHKCDIEGIAILL